MSMKEEKRFKDCGVDGWESIAISDEYKLFYKLIKYDDESERTGFYFKAIECTGWECDGKNEYNFSPECFVFEVFNGTALFDGVRHLHFGDEDGYLYYPSMTKLITAVQELKKLEDKHCDA